MKSWLSFSSEQKRYGEWWIRTTEGVSQQIYSLSHLATLVTPHERVRVKSEELKMKNDGVFPRPFFILNFQFLIISWRRDLNPRPAVYKTAALPLSYSSTNRILGLNSSMSPSSITSKEGGLYSKSSFQAIREVRNVFIG